MCTFNRTFWLGCQHRSEATRYRCATEPFCYAINSANWKSYPCPKCGGPVEEEPIQEEKTEEQRELDSISAEFERIRGEVSRERGERGLGRRLRKARLEMREEIEEGEWKIEGEGEDEEWEREELERRREEMLNERGDKSMTGRPVILRQWSDEDEENEEWEREELERRREEMLSERGEKSMSGRILRTPEWEDEDRELKRGGLPRIIEEGEENAEDYAMMRVGLEEERMTRFPVEDAEDDYVDWVGGRRDPNVRHEDEDWNWSLNYRRRL